MNSTSFRRLVRAGSTFVASAVVVAAAAGCATDNKRDIAYCAYLPDTIGLYVGNPVTQMGYPIGKILDIQPEASHVRVGFSITEQRELPADVKAIIRSPTILADRSMEMVGNYTGGELLDSESCIPLDRTVSPKTLSEVIGSADTFLNAINEAGLENIANTIAGIDRLANGNGAGARNLLATSSALLNSPDQAISDIDSIVRNTATLTTAIKDMRGPLKQVLQDAVETSPDLVVGLDGAARLAGPTGYGTLGPLSETLSTFETRLGEPTQLMLDSISAAIRKVTPHSQALADIFNPVPWWINSLTNYVNGKEWGTFNIAYRPPLFRVPTHDGLALCGFMNASMPGSCADVNGAPYAVDVALLQYVLLEASKR